MELDSNFIKLNSKFECDKVASKSKLADLMKS
jgi:hypothetical protein